MAASAARILRLVLVLALALLGPGSGSDAPCPGSCTCTADRVDCSGLDLTEIPRDLPSRTARSVQPINTDPHNMSHVFVCRRLDHNELTAIPSFGDASSKIVLLHLQHNKISSVDGRLLKPLVALETLDLSNNDLTELRAHCFPAGLRIRELFLASNKIVQMEAGALDRLSSSLQVLRLNRNRLSQIPIKAFQLGHLAQLELSRNKLRMIEGLTFQGLDGLEVLKLQRNNISKLTDGAFWGLSKMRALHLDYNSLREVNSGSLYGLSSLLQLFLSNNSISHINPDGWRFCQKLRELNLSYNNLTRLDEASLAVLGDLHTLRLGHNAIGHVTEGAFRGLRTLRNLELDHNDISGTIEDTNGAFGGLDSLSKLTLFGNKIKSVAKKHAARPFFTPPRLCRVIQSDSFLCDCQLRWFPEWLVARGLQGGVSATCAHPESLKGASLFRAPAERFVCDDLPKPQITVHPESTISVLGKDVRLTCTAASSSSSPMTFAWRKDQELLRHAQMENFAHVSTQDGGVMQYTTILLLHQVTFSHEGRYQCVISNHFGSSYSNKARLTVNVLPSFVKMPRDITIRTGTTARLECAAKGHPTPQIAWQKDGGTDFPAARERRMHVMPDDDVFFIMDVKPEDMGTYSCTAKNTAGTVSANATLTVLETPHLAQDLEDRSVVVGETVALQCKALGSPAPRITWLRGDEPLRPGDRHHFTAGNQLLIIRSAALDDAGRYTCLMSNTLGTERAHCQLSVQRRAHACLAAPGPSTITVGIIVIAVVTSIVVTSLVWVCIIYQTRKKGEECSITNTGPSPWKRAACSTPPRRFPSLTFSVWFSLQMRQSSLLTSRATCPRRERCPSARTSVSGWSRVQGPNPTQELDYQKSHPPTGYSSVPTEDMMGTPNGVRREPQAPTFPSNHDRICPGGPEGEADEDSSTYCIITPYVNFHFSSQVPSTDMVNHPLCPCHSSPTVGQRSHRLSCPMDTFPETP
uniref:Ig-like domain-containing protein n=1 Tax=Denticeps clupeoides TaxID=299321 RepID=A0AAY4BVN2_9TELE